MHLMLLSKAPARTLRVWVRRVSSISTRSAGRVLTRSTNVLAGTVVAPSSATLAPIQQVIPNSRLVADSRKRPSSVATKTLPSTGRVLRGEMARATMLRPLDRFSCRTESYMWGVSAKYTPRPERFVDKPATLEYTCGVAVLELQQ